MTMQWVKGWSGAASDPKWLLVAKVASDVTVMPCNVGTVTSVSFALLDYASANEPRGSIKGFNSAVFSCWSGFDQLAIDAIILAMEKVGIIRDGLFVNWEKRQSEQVSANAIRVRRHRERMKQGETVTSLQSVTVTHSNV